MLLVALVQLASALTFLLLVRKPIFDEAAYESDAGRYERMGMTAAAIRAHTSPAGPGMPLLASFTGRLAPGSLVARRLPIFATWLVGVALLVALAHQRKEDNVVPIAGAVLLSYPHSPLSMATLLSEGPSFTCAMAGLLASGLVRAPGTQPLSAARLLLAGAFVGLSLWFRQYYLALVPAFFVTWWRDPARLRKWAFFAIGPLVVLGAYYVLWGGLTSPMARLGLLYGVNTRATVAFNPLRPLSALAYVGVYALPFLPWEDRERLPRRDLLKIVLAGFAAALALILSGRTVWGWGPILSFIEGTTRLHLRAVADVAVTGAAFTGVLVVGRLLWEARARWNEPFGLLCTAVVAFFALEQAGVDGSFPFYERYAHQVIFFSSALVIIVTRPRTWRVLAFIAVLVIVSELTLWSKGLSVLRS